MRAKKQKRLEGKAKPPAAKIYKMKEGWRGK
jgi:hypothetical protein